MKNILDKIAEWMEPIKNFMIENKNNPILMLALLGIGLLIFSLVYRALQKEK